MSRLLAASLALVLLMLAWAPAEADSWMAPTAKLANSLDGRWYVLVEPDKNFRDARFRLVERAKGKPPRTLPAIEQSRRGPALPIKLEKGDRLVASGSTTMPMEVRCLDRGKGFVLFETYGQIGSGRVVDVHDGSGALRFTRTLPEVLSADRRKSLRRSVSSVWWYAGWWVDEAARDIVLLWQGTDAGGVIRMTLKDGVSRDGVRTDVLARLDAGHPDERIKALKQAAAWKVPGTLAAVGKAFDDQTTPLLSRLHYGTFLFDRGDERAKPLFAAAALSEELPVRRYAVRHLALAMDTAALPLLKKAMHSEDHQLRDSAEYALRTMGKAAVPTLIEMISDESAPERYRAGAAIALWNMDVQHTLEAEAALAKAAKSKLERLAYAAGHAHKQIAEYKAKQAGEAK